MTAIIWVFALPVVLLIVVFTRLDEAPAGTNGWRLVVVCLVGLSNHLAAYFIGSVFTGSMSHDDPPWNGIVCTVFLVAAAAFV